MISTEWNDSDNIYFLSRNEAIVNDFYNDGTMGMFEASHDGKVNRCVAIYVKNHTRSESLRYNNNLYFGIVNPQQVHKDQYETNRKFILNKFLYIIPFYPIAVTRLLCIHLWTRIVSSMH